MHRPTIAALFLLLTHLAPPLMAQQNALPALTDEIAAQFPAIGRIGRKGFEKQGCSGTLIAPDLVVTAAHCLPKPAPIERRVFATQWSNGTPLTTRRIKREMRHPGYATNGKHGPRNDVGLIVLDTPILDVQPIPLGTRETGGLDGAEVALVGYHTARPDALSGNLACPAVNLAVGLVHVGCPVIQGNSGAPVVVQNETGTWQLEAIISSRIGRGAIAVYLPDWLRQEVAKHLQP